MWSRLIYAFFALLLLTGCSGDEPSYKGKAVKRLSIGQSGGRAFTFEYMGNQWISSMRVGSFDFWGGYGGRVYEFNYTDGEVLVDIYSRFYVVDASSAPTPDARMVATLDPKGRVITSSCYTPDYIGDAMDWSLQVKTKYTYDENNHLVKSEELIRDGWMRSDTIVYEWAQGDLVRLVYADGRKCELQYTELPNLGRVDLNWHFIGISSEEQICWWVAGLMGARSRHVVLPSHWLLAQNYLATPVDYALTLDADGDLTSITSTASNGETLEVTLTY